MKPIEQRFWSKVNKTKTCWLWTGAVNEYGYGRFCSTGTKRPYAHKFSWEMKNGKPPAGLIVCHKCDTPACVRTAHLFLGTNQDNTTDAILKGRLAANRWYRNTGIGAKIAVMKERGATNRETSKALGISPKTVQAHNRTRKQCS